MGLANYTRHMSTERGELESPCGLRIRGVSPCPRLKPPHSSLFARFQTFSPVRNAEGRAVSAAFAAFSHPILRPDPFTGYQPTCCKQASPFTSTSRGWSPRRSSAELLHLTRVPSRANARRTGALAKRQSLNRSRLVTSPLIEACFQEAAMAGAKSSCPEAQPPWRSVTSHSVSVGPACSQTFLMSLGRTAVSMFMWPSRNLWLRARRFPVNCSWRRKAPSVSPC